MPKKLYHTKKSVSVSKAINSAVPFAECLYIDKWAMGVEGNWRDALRQFRRRKKKI